jgi:hypothetical protein
MTVLMQEVLLIIVSLAASANEPASQFAYNQSCTIELVRGMVQAAGAVRAFAAGAGVGFIAG